MSEVSIERNRWTITKHVRISQDASQESGAPSDAQRYLAVSIEPAVFSGYPTPSWPHSDARKPPIAREKGESKYENGSLRPIS